MAEKDIEILLGRTAHEEAIKCAEHLIMIDRAMAELYDLKQVTQDKLRDLSVKLSPGDAIRGLLPIMQTGASRDFWYQTAADDNAP